ncbi:MAG TPA: reverse transcriptase family protein, partial [Kofleriaceae bacterium]
RLAAAFVDAPLERDVLVARAIHVVRDDQPWLHVLVDDVLRLGPEGPRDDEPDPDDGADDGDEPVDDRDRFARLRDWILQHHAFKAGLRQGARAARVWIDPPEMRDSPWRVPALPTTGELARWLGVVPERLAILADRRNLSRDSVDPRARHYRYMWLAKPTGGHRLLEALKPTLRRIQRNLLDEIVANVPPHDAAHGFCRGRSVRTFAEPHVRRDVVLRFDLRAFFTSITMPRVAAIFFAAGYPEHLAATLAELCTHATPRDVLARAPSPPDHVRLRSRHLPQGAPTSGALANLVAYGFDVRMSAFAAKLGAHYTRYADDLALSGDVTLARRSAAILRQIRTIALDEGFAVNLPKTRVMRAATQQRLTGIVVNDRLAIARSEIERLRAILHNCIRFGPASQNRANVADFRSHLVGRCAWITSIDPRKGARLAAQLARIEW